MTWSLQNDSLDIATLRKHFHERTLRPTELVEAEHDRISHCSVPRVCIHLLPRRTVLAEARELESRWKGNKSCMPLYGIPYAIKDNIDVAGRPITAPMERFTQALAAPTEMLQGLPRVGGSAS